MNAPAPYTRETLDRIRAGATAPQLGWLGAFYDVVCRKHGIERAGAKPAPEAPRQAVVCDDIVWNAKTNELSRGSAAIALTDKQARIFTHVFSAFLAGKYKFVAARMMIARSGCNSTSAFSYIVQSFNRRAVSLQISIESRKGPVGGYRLIDLCSVASASMKNPTQKD